MRATSVRRFVAVLLTLALLALLSASVGAVSGTKVARVPAGSAARVLPGHVSDTISASKSGRAAVASIGARLPSVARRYGWTPAQLAGTLLADPTLHVDTTDRLFYVEPPAKPLSSSAIASASGADTPQAAAPFPMADTFKLHSLPGAKLTILLDFGGRTMSGNAWTAGNNSGNDIVCPPWSLDSDPTFSDAERTAIQQVWQRVAEDYAPFNVDVTTEFTGEDAITRSSSSDTVYGTRVLISPISSYFGAYGGIAYIGVFGSVGDYYKPALVFPEMLAGNNTKDIAEAAAHECGHNLGLRHDGTSTQGYYAGSGSGETGWAPIMGVGYYQNLSEWSRGEYPDANNQEDDLSIIQGYLGYRADDAGDTASTASVLATSTTLAAAGLIGSSSDVDVYRFAAGPGAAAIDVKSASVGPDLDILAELRDSAGNLIASSNPADSLSAHLGQTLASGTYYLTVRGTGKGSPLDVGGYSNYASIGRYTVSGTVAAVTPAAEPVFSPAGGTFTGSVDVAMTCATAGATIRYTTDGTTPTSASPTYAGVPLHLTSTARLQAVAFEPGWSPSALHAETYTIVPGPFQIAVSASTNGTITPPGVQTVSYGSSKTFAITPVSGYHIVRVLVDGTSIGASSSVTFSNVAANHTLSASFASAYSVVPSAAAHGAISPNTAQTIAAGGDVTFAVTPDSAYRIADVLVDGASVGASASVTLHHVAADHTVSATFWPVSVFQTVWRFRNPGSGYYLWTADPAEKDHIVAALPGTWIFEGPAYPIDVTSPLNNSPLWRFRNLKSDFYLYTADPVEKASIITNLAASWRFEGAAYSVERVFTTGSQTVWRFRNTRDGSYFFTADPAEKDRIIAKLAAAWKYEGPSFFLAP